MGGTSAGVKGTLQENPFLKNKFRISVVGLVPFYAIEISGLVSELGVAELPDGTTVSTGVEKPGEFTVKTPTHHKVDQVLLEGWKKSCMDPVVPTSKKVVTIEAVSNDGETVKAWECVGCYPFKNEVDDFQKNSADSELHVTTWSFKYDSLTAL